MFCDVLTCTTPDYEVELRYASFGFMKNIKIPKRHIKLLPGTAAASRCDTLIPDVFGCRAFLNDPAKVARTFAEELWFNFRGCFKDAVFAIPEPSGLNYKASGSVFREQSLLRKY